MKQVKSRATGDIGELDFDSKEGVFIVVYYNLLTKVTSKRYYKGLKELNEEWEDYEEPKDYWFISDGAGHEVGIFASEKGLLPEIEEYRKEIGNYFETKEEAEKAVEKLKAWKRLKDKGLKANRTEISGDNFICEFTLPDHSDYSQSVDDFELAVGLEYEE